MATVKLTEFSHCAGCASKISPGRSRVAGAAAARTAGESERPRGHRDSGRCRHLQDLRRRRARAHHRFLHADRRRSALIRCDRRRQRNLRRLCDGRHANRRAERGGLPRGVGEPSALGAWRHPGRRRVEGARSGRGRDRRPHRGRRGAQVRARRRGDHSSRARGEEGRRETRRSSGALQGDRHRGSHHGAQARNDRRGGHRRRRTLHVYAESRRLSGDERNRRACRDRHHRFRTPGTLASDVARRRARCRDRLARDPNVRRRTRARRERSSRGRHEEESHRRGRAHALQERNSRGRARAPRRRADVRRTLDGGGAGEVRRAARAPPRAGNAGGGDGREGDEGRRGSR